MLRKCASAISRFIVVDIRQNYIRHNIISEKLSDTQKHMPRFKNCPGRRNNVESVKKQPYPRIVQSMTSDRNADHLREIKPHLWNAVSDVEKALVDLVAERDGVPPKILPRHLGPMKPPT